jgi:hypothetical protein
MHGIILMRFSTLIHYKLIEEKKYAFYYCSAIILYSLHSIYGSAKHRKKHTTGPTYLECNAKRSTDVSF